MIAENKNIDLDIAILGGGFTGVYCARTAARALGQDAATKVGLISEENYMVFQPMLPEVAGSAISPRHVVNPLRLLCRPARVLKGKVEEIHWPERSLVLNAGSFSGNFIVRYKHLVLALGAAVNLSRIPGMPEHSFPMRNAGDAMALRTALIGRMEEANLERRPEIKRRLLTFVVVGGGYSGVETAGHMLDLFASIHGYYPNVSMSDLQVYLVHGEDQLLANFSRSLGEYSARKLTARGLKLVLSKRVKAVTSERVYLQDGSTIETNTVISTVGNAPHPLVTRMCERYGFECVKGRLVTEPTCQVKGQTDLWAGGDCAAVPFVKGGFCPETAQFAMRQGLLIGRNLARQARGRPLRRFTFKGYGEMASIGHHTAVADIFGIKFSGFVAWWIWRTIYLLKLPRIDRKIRVMLDWTLDLFFPRDINHLSPRSSELLNEIHLERGDVLFEIGEPAFSLYIIKSGCLEIREADGFTRRIGAGEYFGEQPLLEDGIWRHEAVAIEPTTLVSLPAGMFRQIVYGAGSLGRFFQKSAAKYQSREVLEMISAKINPELADLPVAELMQRELYTFRPDLTVREALEVARRHPRSSYPVIGADDRLLGVVTREDFYEFIKRPETTEDTRLEQLRFSSPTIAGETASVAEILSLLIRTGANKVLVVGGDHHVSGIITVVDILAAQGVHAGEAGAALKTHARAG